MFEDHPGWADNIERLVVILFLGLVALGAVITAFILTVRGMEPPDMLQILGATAVGALGGMLTGAK